VAGIVVSALVLAVMWAFDISLSRAALLAPVIVVAAGAALGVVVLWAKVGWESLRSGRRPGLTVALVLGAVALIAVLSVIGVTLPRE
jgi:hypothetical protein